jgi:hypothetical protein
MLIAQGYRELPDLPPKMLWHSESDYEKRQIMLERYMILLVERKDTRNSDEVVSFLRLKDICPEVVFNQPELLVNQVLKNRFVTHCLFISKFNMYVLAVFDKSLKCSCLEVYYFHQTGLVADKYRLRSQSEMRDE